MLSDLNYLSIKENGLIPSDVIEIDLTGRKNDLVPLSKIESVNSSNSEFGVIADNPQWVVQSKSTGVIYSCDGKFVYGYSHVSDEEGEYIKYLPKDKLVPIKKFKIRRNDNMSDTNQTVQERIAKMKQEQEAKRASNIQDSTAFAGDAKAGKEMSEDKKLAKMEADKKLENLTNSIRNLSKDVQLNNVSDLYAYNQTRSELIGWITDRDSRIHAKVDEKVIIDPATKKPKVKGNAPQEVLDLIVAGKRPSKEYLETTCTLKVNQMAPGAAKFAIMEMPIDGIIPMDKLRDPKFEIDLDITKKADKVVKFYSKKEFVATTIALLGGSVKESAITNADPTIVNVFLKAKPVTDKETGNTENKLTPSITTASKRKLITATNYFPKTTFATISLDQINSEEDRNKANLSLFGHLFRSVGGNAAPYTKLDAAEKEKLTQEAGKIVSKFFDPASQLPLNVVNVFTGAEIANPQIPLKVEKPTKDGKGTRLVNVTFDVTKPEADQPAGIDPFKDARFAKILEACGGKLTKEVITDLYAKSKKRKKAAGTSGIILSAEESTKIYLNAASLDDNNNSALKEVSFSDALSADELRNFTNESLQSLNEYYANR